jgi:hypothetical protein
VTQTKKQSGAEARYGELARERFRLEEMAEEQVSALSGTLREIVDLDDRQRTEAHEAGRLLPQTPAHGLISGWLGDRLGGHKGFAGLVRGLDHERTLAERDPMAEQDAQG